MTYDFGIRLKKLREDKNLSQVAAAKKLGLTRSSISAYENNIKQPKLDTLIKLAVLYNASVDYILGFNNRTNLYLDDLSESERQLVIDIVVRLKQHFKK